jgi:hypothetical protein
VSVENPKVSSEPMTTVKPDKKQSDRPVTGVVPQDLLRKVAAETGDFRLADLADSLDREQPLDDEGRDFVDGVLAGLTIDDDGKIRDDVDADNWENIKLWLAGDSDVTPNIEAKRVILRQHEVSLQLGEIAASVEFADHDPFMEGVEPMPLGELALVRSSEHRFEINEAGEVIIYPAAQYRSDVIRQSECILLLIIKSLRMDKVSGATVIF